MSQPRPTNQAPLCASVDFIEVELPRPITPRLVIRLTQGLSINIESPAEFPLASDFSAAPANTHRNEAVHDQPRYRRPKNLPFPRPLRSCLAGQIVCGEDGGAFVEVFFASACLDETNLGMQGGFGVVSSAMISRLWTVATGIELGIKAWRKCSVKYGTAAQCRGFCFNPR